MRGKQQHGCWSVCRPMPGAPIARPIRAMTAAAPASPPVSTAAAITIRTATNNNGERYLSPTRDAMNDELHSSTKPNGANRLTWVGWRLPGRHVPPHARRREIQWGPCFALRAQAMFAPGQRRSRAIAVMEEPAAGRHGLDRTMKRRCSANATTPKECHRRRCRYARATAGPTGSGVPAHLPPITRTPGNARADRRPSPARSHHDQPLRGNAALEQCARHHAGPGTQFKYGFIRGSFGVAHHAPAQRIRRWYDRTHLQRVRQPAPEEHCSDWRCMRFVRGSKAAAPPLWLTYCLSSV